MQRLLILFIVLVLGLVPTVIQAGSQQEDRQCNDSTTFVGEFLDSSYEANPDADAVVVRYQFTFPPDVYLPMRFYSATMFVSVEAGPFSLEVGEDQSEGQTEGTPIPRWGPEGRTTVVRVNPEPVSADEALVAPGEIIEELVAEDKIFHDGGVYRYRNTSGETATLLVSVIVPRDQYEEALAAGQEAGLEEGRPLHEAICPWCERFVQFDFAEVQSTTTSAKLLPALQCGGG